MCPTAHLLGGWRANERNRHYARSVTAAEQPYRLLRDALWQLSLEPDEQRRHLAGTAVTDELALDLDNAVSSLAHAASRGGPPLSEEVSQEVQRLNTLTNVPPEDSLWDDEALDRHATWAEARVVARRLLPLLPSRE
jgi:hypothetical protein